MEHIDDINLFEYVSGRLPDAEAEQLRQHMAGCPACQKRYQDVVDVWDSLGQWHVDSSGHQIADRIEALAAEDESGRRKSPARTNPFMRSFTAALRVAAAVTIAIGAGHLLGRYSLSRHTPELPISQDAPRYVAALGFEWSSELMWTVLEEEAVPGETN
jgi:anti-sigma factor RsiW